MILVIERPIPPNARPECEDELPPPPADRSGQRITQLRRFSALLLFAAAGVLLLQAGWIHAKAELAQHLLERAWQRVLAGEADNKPWPWADTHPVARISAPRLGISQIVLAGDSGRTLAFGPGWAEASATPGGIGTSVISGHRDTHFAWLGKLQPGDLIALHGAQGARNYRVERVQRADALLHQLEISDEDALWLVTCWPLDGVASGGSERYLVQALPEPLLASKD